MSSRAQKIVCGASCRLPISTDSCALSFSTPTPVGVEALARVIIHHGQHSNHSARAHAVTQKIDRPTFIRLGRLHFTWHSFRGLGHLDRDSFFKRGVFSAATPVVNSHLDCDQKSVSAPILALPEQEYTPGDTLSEVPYVPFSLVSSTRL
jgi:hypothetical protein